MRCAGPRRQRWTRWLAAGGVVGPVGFVTAWAVAGARTPGYSPIDDAISRLAAVHAPSRALMSTGFVLFGLGLPAFAVALRDGDGGPAWMTAATTGICTLGVAALPLDAGVDGWHAAAAVAGYATLAATPWLAAGQLAWEGRTRAAAAARLAGATSALLLAASLLGPKHGLFQRAGLGAGDVWVGATALGLLRSSRAAAV